MVEAIIENKTQYDYLIDRNDIDIIIISRDCFYEKDIVSMVDDIKTHGKRAYIRFERISRFDEEYIKDNRLIKDKDIYDYRKIMSIKNLDGVLIQNIDSFNKVVGNVKKGKNAYDNIDIVLDYTMNVYNNEMKNVLDKYFKENGSYNIELSYTYPIELSIKDMQNLSMDTLVVYSHLPVIVSANCIHKSTGRCKCNEVGCIKDRMNKNVYYKSYCKYCYSKIFNPDEYYIADMLYVDNKENDIIRNLSYKNIRYEFSIEDVKIIEKILSNKPAKDILSSYTRGHISKSID